VRRRRERRHGSPDCEYAASATRGAKWGIEARRNARRGARRRGTGSPFASIEPPLAPPGAASLFATLDAGPASPFSTLDLALLGGSGEWRAVGSPTSTVDLVPACAVNSLVDALRGFWTRERINGCGARRRRGRGRWFGLLPRRQPAVCFAGD
jgi:hypothetical protein